MIPLTINPDPLRNLRVSGVSYARFALDQRSKLVSKLRAERADTQLITGRPLSIRSFLQLHDQHVRTVRSPAVHDDIRHSQRFTITIAVVGAFIRQPKPAKLGTGRVSADLEARLTAQLPQWIRNVAFGRPYESEMDEDYLYVTRYLFERVFATGQLENCFESLFEVARWMEIIGDRQTNQWARRLLAEEAPGTGFDRDRDRDHYVRSAGWSPSFHERHLELLAEYQSRVVPWIGTLVRTAV